MKKYAIFLGAGASASCGAPTQNNLLKEYFLGRRTKQNNDEYNLERELATFFAFMFGIDVDNGDLENTNFPTFEEALGIIDLALTKNESLKDFEIGSNSFSSENRLLACREHLVHLMASILYDKLYNVENNHKILISNLDKADILKDCIFISTNYDILIDNAISDFIFTSAQYCIDYGFTFENILNSDTNKFQIPLYKLHGSLNWLHCPTCNTMTCTGSEKGVIRLIRPLDFGNPYEVLCERCNSLKSAVIIPPTYFKQFTNYYIHSVWFKVEQALREVDKIIFCGYSFPDADLYVKYMLKRIETNRHKPLDIIVYNNYPKKKKVDKDNEVLRYNRFFIKTVNYTKMGFKEFVNNPNEFLS